MKKIILLIPFIFTFNLQADPIQDVDRNHPFKEFFDRNLYDFSKVNAYDEDPLQPGQVVHIGTTLNETPDQKIKRLKKRKLNSLNKKIVLPITNYLLNLNQRSIKDYAAKGLIGLGSTFGAGYFFGNNQTPPPLGGPTGDVVRQGAQEATKKATEEVAKVIAESADDVAGAVTSGSGGGAAAANTGGGFNWTAFGVTIAANITVNVIAEMLNDGPERQKTVEGNLLINTLRQKIDAEEVQPLEEDFIKRKNEYNSEWCEAIEKALLATRKEQGSLNNVDRVELVRELLQFPTTTKLLPPTYNLGDSDFAQKTKAFVTQAFEPNDRKLSLNHYKGAIRTQLKRVLTEICQCSKVAASNGQGQRRKSYVFYGIPGTGKSVAAKLIAEETGLPVYHLDIANRDDFSQSALYGASNVLHHNKGHLPQAFLKKNKDGKRSNNIVVVLDDVDRALPRDPATGKIKDEDGLLKILLKLLDLHTEEFTAEYYGVKKDMRDVIFICTTNTDFTAKVHGDMFNALKSRARVIRFEPPGSDEKKDRIKAYLTDALFEDSLEFSGQPDQWDTLRQEVANFIVDKHDTDDQREIERRAVDLLNEPQSEWDNLADASGWQSSAGNDAEPDEQDDADTDILDDEGE